MLYKIDNIHNERETCYTDSTLPGYSIMSVVCIIYVYQDSALNHMVKYKLNKTINYPILLNYPQNENLSLNVWAVYSLTEEVSVFAQR